MKLDAGKKLLVFMKTLSKVCNTIFQALPPVEDLPVN